MALPLQAITFDATSSVLRFGRTPLVAGSGETLHTMNNFIAPNTDHHIFWKVESNIFVAMSGGEKATAIAWYKESLLYDIGDSGASFTVDWANGETQKVAATGNADVTMTETESTINELLPRIKPEVKILKIINAGGTRTFTWPNNIYWSNGVPNVPTGTHYFIFARFLDDYIGARYSDGA